MLNREKVTDLLLKEYIEYLDGLNLLELNRLLNEIEKNKGG